MTLYNTRPVKFSNLLLFCAKPNPCHVNHDLTRTKALNTSGWLIAGAGVKLLQIADSLPSLRF